MICSNRLLIIIRRSPPPPACRRPWLARKLTQCFESIEHLQHNRPDNNDLQPPPCGEVEVFRDKQL